MATPSKQPFDVVFVAAEIPREESDELSRLAKLFHQPPPALAAEILVAALRILAGATPTEGATCQAFLASSLSLHQALCARVDEAVTKSRATVEQSRALLRMLEPIVMQTILSAPKASTKS